MFRESPDFVKVSKKIMVRTIVFLDVSKHGDHFGMLHKISFCQTISNMVKNGVPRADDKILRVGKSNKRA
jgi:hypothetical protein